MLPRVIAPTEIDKVKNATINIGGTFVLALVWLALVWVWKQEHLPGKVYLMSLAPMMYLCPYLVSLRYTSLKGRLAYEQSILIVGLTAALTMMLVFAGWISTRM